MMLGAWVFSVLVATFYTQPGSQQWSIWLAHGRIGFTTKTYFSFQPGWTCLHTYLNYWEQWTEMPWTEIARFAGFGSGLSADFGGLEVPVWLLVVAVGFPTAILWWRDRRPKAGFCKVCKYDLTGNESGTCPECGTGVE